MRSRLLDIAAALNDVYSGWILWNLFLAFIPLVLSFILFRRGAIAQRWLWWLLGAVGFIGVFGFIPRYARVIARWMDTLGDAIAGDPTALLSLAWVFTLGIIALVLSLFLFQRKRTFRTLIWWLGLAAFIAFLPNAPYLLTDIIHLIRGTSSGQVPTWIVALVFIPLHVVAILLGFEAYVLSLLNQNYYLKQRGAAQWIAPTEILIHALSAVGIFLGRFVRLNSWDVLADPSSVLIITLNTLTSRRPLLVIFITFVILTLFYWIMKQVTLGLRLRLHYARQGIDISEILEERHSSFRS